MLLQCETAFGAFLQAYAENRGRPHWGLKTPADELHATSMLGHFPEVHFIHVVCDPRNVVVSMMKTDFVKHVALSMPPHRFEISRVLAWWKMSTQAATTHEKRCPNRYHVVRYEGVDGGTAPPSRPCPRRESRLRPFSASTVLLKQNPRLSGTNGVSVSSLHLVENQRVETLSNRESLDSVLL